jgi:hypothetical protein
MTLEKETTEDDTERLVVRTSIQMPVLTANFEAGTPIAPEWYFKADSPGVATANGPASTQGGGVSGSCALLEKAGAFVDYGSRPIFAPTDGIAIEFWVKPIGGGQGGTLLRGEDPDGGPDLYLVRLAKQGDAYDVEVHLRLSRLRVGARERDTTGIKTVFRTEGAPILPGKWSDVRFTFDGLDAHLYHRGLDRMKRDVPRGVAVSKPVAQRFALPRSGVVKLTLGAPTGGFVGAVDTLSISGVFRSDEDVRELNGAMRVIRPTLPIRIVYTNGRLDPTVHAQDVVVVLVSDADLSAGAYQGRFGLWGQITGPTVLPLTQAEIESQTATDGKTPPAAPGTAPAPGAAMAAAMEGSK